MSESRNVAETEHVSVEVPLNMYRTASNETDLISKTPNVINEENFTIAPEQGKNQFQFSVIIFVKSKHFLILILRVNLTIKLLEIIQQVLPGTLIKGC